MPQGPEEMRQAIVRNLPEKTGRGLEEWVRMVKAAVPEGGMNEKVAWLRSEHDLGMGTARVIASAAEGEKGYFSELPGKLLSDQYAGAKAGLMPVYRKLAQAAKELGRDVSLDPRKTYVSVSRDKQFAVIQASRPRAGSTWGSRLRTPGPERGCSPPARSARSGSPAGSRSPQRMRSTAR